MKIFYSVLSFQSSYKIKPINPPFEFDKQTFWVSGNFSDFTDENFANTWKEWLGSTRWYELTKNCSDFICTWQNETNALTYTDGTSNLESKIIEINRALPTVTSHCFSYTDNLFLISGSGQLVNGKIKIEDISTFSNINSYQIAYFLNNEHGLDDPLFDQSAMLEHLKSNYEKIDNKIFNLKNKQLLESLRSFEEAFRTRQLEFKIPTLVRAIECIIDCWGAEQFALRIIDFIGMPEKEEYFKMNSDYKDRLLDIYKLRNDCSHGKDFAFSLKLSGKEPTNYEIARFEYILEYTARKVFKKAINDESLGDIFLTREGLERYFKNKYK
jgi:hypothetical protein